MAERPVTGFFIGHPIMKCHRCGRETAHSDDGILCLFCGLTTYTDEDNQRNYERFTVKSDKEWKDKEVQIDRTMGQLGRLAQLSNEDLKEKVESLDKHRKRST